MVGRLTRRPPRVLGRWGRPSGEPGPVLICVGGLHGNEPTGVGACGRVVAELERLAPEARGRLVALAGNRGALDGGERYLDRDLNRMWSDGELARAGEPGGPRERAELAELSAAIEAEVAAAQGEVVILDLHSTSAPGAPFCILASGGRSEELASCFGVPVLVGLRGTVPGTLVEYYGCRGVPALCVEGGENGTPDTAAHHEAAVWVLLAALGVVDPALAGVAGHRDRLLASALGLPGIVRVSYRHELEDGEVFEMVPGFENFSPVAANTLLGTSSRGGGTEVRAPFDGLLVMPRYQGQGEDGFFLGTEDAERAGEPPG
ncbi:MAG: succinylglutamate desuccinylase/aspartoacylase family protein [Planctomycetota bacterium]